MIQTTDEQVRELTLIQLHILLRLHGLQYEPWMKEEWKITGKEDKDELEQLVKAYIVGLYDNY